MTLSTRSTDADPAHLYHDVLVAIDPARRLNNGQPSYLAFCLDALDLREADCVLHVGCGVGYYTAIAAEVVGPGGRVIGVEIDADLAHVLAITFLLSTRGGRSGGWWRIRSRPLRCDLRQRWRDAPAIRLAGPPSIRRAAYSLPDRGVR